MQIKRLCTRFLYYQLLLSLDEWMDGWIRERLWSRHWECLLQNYSHTYVLIFIYITNRLIATYCVPSATTQPPQPPQPNYNLESNSIYRQSNQLIIYFAPNPMRSSVIGHHTTCPLSVNWWHDHLTTVGTLGETLGRNSLLLIMSRKNRITCSLVRVHHTSDPEVGVETVYKACRSILQWRGGHKPRWETFRRGRVSAWNESYRNEMLLRRKRE